MARNLIKELTTIAAIDLVPDHPSTAGTDTDVNAGDPFRVGAVVFMALINEQFGYGTGGYRANPRVNLPRDPSVKSGTQYGASIGNGSVPGSAQYNIWAVDVFNDGGSEAPIGTPVYYYDTADGPSGDVNYHLVCGVASAADAYAGILMETIPADSAKKGVQLLLGAGVPTSTGNLTPVAIT